MLLGGAGVVGSCIPLRTYSAMIAASVVLSIVLKLVEEVGVGLVFVFWVVGLTVEVSMPSIASVRCVNPSFIVSVLRFFDCSSVSLSGRRLFICSLMSGDSQASIRCVGGRQCLEAAESRFGVAYDNSVERTFVQSFFCRVPSIQCVIAVCCRSPIR